MTSTVATKLAEARGLIERGWCKHRFARNGRVCAVGAINEAVNGDPRDWQPSVLLGEVREKLRLAIGRLDISEWNDARKRKKSEVIEAFKRAEQLARGGAE